MTKSKIILISILIVSILLRSYQVTKVPPSLNWDEVSQGYNAYSILKTGKDEWGIPLPLTNFRAYGDYPTTFYMYATIPFIYLFGLNEVSIRLPSIIFGGILPLIIYFFVSHLTKRKSIGLVVAFFSALSPWGILLSRQTIQAVPAATLLATGVLLFILGMKKKTWLVFLGTVALGLSAFAYHNTRIFSPIFFIVLLLIYRNEFKKNLKLFVSTVFIAIIFFLPTTLAALSKEGSARSAFVGILNLGAINEINTARGSSNLTPVLARLVHNKVTYFISVASRNYFGYFSPKFLFFKGGTQYQFNVQNFGVINPLESLFFYIGIIMLFAGLKKLDNSRKVILTWLLLAPIPAAITHDPYQVVRATNMLPVIYLVTGLGLEAFGKFTKSIPLNIIFWILYFVWFGFYLNNLSSNYSIKYSEAWQYGYKEVFQFLKDVPAKKVFITKRYGEAHMFYAFYTKLDPRIIQDNTKSIRYAKSDWFWTDKIGDVYFINDWDIPKTAVRFLKLESGGVVDTAGSILVTSPDHVPANFSIINTINFLDGKPAFLIGRL